MNHLGCFVAACSAVCLSFSLALNCGRVLHYCVTDMFRIEGLNLPLVPGVNFQLADGAAFCSDIPDGQVRKFRPHLLNLSKSSELHERVQIHRVDTTNTTTWGHPYRTASVPSTRHQLLQVKLTTPSCTLEAWCIFLRSACRADRQQPVEWWQRGPRSYLAARIRNNVVKRIS